MASLLFSFALLIAATGCCRPAQIVVASNEANTLVPVDDWLARHALPAGQNIKAQLLGQTDSLSYHVVQIRDREQPHVHAAHDLSVTLLRGEGSLFVRGLAQKMRRGDVAVIPRGTPHYFVNEGSQPAAAFVIFAPRSDGADNVPVR